MSREFLCTIVCNRGLVDAVDFASIASTDLPLATVGTPGAVQPDGTTITISNGVITAVGGSAGPQAAHAVYAGPTSGGSATPTFRALVAADIPTLNQSTTGQAGTVATIAGLLSAGTNITITGSGTSASPYSIAASGGGGSLTVGTTPVSDGEDGAILYQDFNGKLGADSNLVYHGQGMLSIGVARSQQGRIEINGSSASTPAALFVTSSGGLEITYAGGYARFTGTGLFVGVGSVSAEGSFNFDQTPTAINGSVSGSMTACMPFQGYSYKKVLLVLSALHGTATYTFATAFTIAPAIATLGGTNGLGSSIVSSLSATSVTISTTTATTGFLILEGS